MMCAQRWLVIAYFSNAAGRHEHALIRWLTDRQMVIMERFTEGTEQALIENIEVAGDPSGTDGRTDAHLHHLSGDKVDTNGTGHSGVSANGSGYAHSNGVLAAHRHNGQGNGYALTGSGAEDAQVSQRDALSARFNGTAPYTADEPIAFNVPTLAGNELSYLNQAIQAQHISGDGIFTKRASQLLEETLGVPKVMLTTSCTHALEMAAILLDIQPGDEVIVPSFTFVSTVNAFVLRGARPVFSDVRPDTLNMDERQLEALITPRTKAIVPVHYAGVGCEMDEICAIAERHNVAVVEDNAHGLYGKYKGRYLGTFGTFATQSFHETKNFSCGEGGALLINDRRYIEQAEIIREKGTNRSRFFRGQVDKYTWVDVGSSYLPSDMLAAYLFAQLEARDAIQQKRQAIWHYYQTHLQEWAEERQVQMPQVPTHCEQSYHMYYLLLPTLEERTAFIDHLKAQGIQSVFHYLPLHTAQMGNSFGWQTGDCPVTEAVSDQLVRLPFHHKLDEAALARIVQAIRTF